MKRNLKIAAAVATLFLACGAIVLTYATSQSGPTPNNGETASMYIANNATHVQTNCKSPGINGAYPWEKKFLENATATTVNGTVITEFRGMLILDTGPTEIRILLPRFWSVDKEVIGRAKLFNSSFSSPGGNITANILESKMFNGSNFSIEVMVGYEITNATGTSAYAVLPFNIIPNS